MSNTLCPKCDGSGRRRRATFNGPNDDVGNCDVCNGTGQVPNHIEDVSNMVIPSHEKPSHEKHTHEYHGLECVHCHLLKSSIETVEAIARNHAQPTDTSTDCDFCVAWQLIHGRNCSEHEPTPDQPQEPGLTGRLIVRNDIDLDRDQEVPTQQAQADEPLDAYRRLKDMGLAPTTAHSLARLFDEWHVECLERDKPLIRRQAKIEVLEALPKIFTDDDELAYKIYKRDFDQAIATINEQL